MQAKVDVEKWITEVLSVFFFFIYYSVTWKKNQVSNQSDRIRETIQLVKPRGL